MILRSETSKPAVRISLAWLSVVCSPVDTRQYAKTRVIRLFQLSKKGVRICAHVQNLSTYILDMTSPRVRNRSISNSRQLTGVARPAEGEGRDAKWQERRPKGAARGGYGGSQTYWQPYRWARTGPKFFCLPPRWIGRWELEVSAWRTWRSAHKPGYKSLFSRLQGIHSIWQFSAIVFPPFDHGIMWSPCISSMSNNCWPPSLPGVRQRVPWAHLCF
jgi:hypothetical protein